MNLKFAEVTSGTMYCKQAVHTLFVASCSGNTAKTLTVCSATDVAPAQLTEMFPCYFIPALPDKATMNLFGSRFEESFVEGRRIALEQFLNRIVRHPDLVSSKVVKVRS